MNSIWTFVFLGITFGTTLINVKASNLREKQDTDVSKLLLFTCEFCENIAETQNELECDKSKECIEITSLCTVFQSQCCSSEASDECAIISRKGSFSEEIFSDEKPMVKKRALRKKKAFLKKRQESMEGSDSSSSSSSESNDKDKIVPAMKTFHDTYEKKSLKRVFPFKKRF